VSVSVIVPTYNEAAAIKSVVQEYLQYADEIVVVDDGSTDGTADIVDELAASESAVISCHHINNKGKANAIRTGVSRATGDILVFTDADETYPAEYLEDLVKQVEQGSDLVLGSRLANGTANIPTVNKFGNRLLSMFVSFVGGVSLEDAQTGMRAMRRESFAELDAVGANNLEFETRMTVRAAKMGYNISEVPIEYRERTGNSKLRPVRDGYSMLYSIVDTLLAEASPVLRFAIVSSLLLFLAGTYTGLVSVINTIRTGFVQHQFYPLLTVFFYITGFHLLTVTLMSEHVRNRIDRIDDKIDA